MSLLSYPPTQGTYRQVLGLISLMMEISSLSGHSRYYFHLSNFCLVLTQDWAFQQVETPLGPHVMIRVRQH